MNPGILVLDPLLFITALSMEKLTDIKYTSALSVIFLMKTQAKVIRIGKG